MPSATIVLLVALGTLVVVLLATAVVLVRSLARTSEALTVLGRRLEQAEERLGDLHEDVTGIAGDVVDLAAIAGRQARDLDGAPAPTDPPGAGGGDVADGGDDHMTDTDEFGSHHA